MDSSVHNLDDEAEDASECSAPFVDGKYAEFEEDDDLSFDLGVPATAEFAIPSLPVLDSKIATGALDKPISGIKKAESTAHELLLKIVADAQCNPVALSAQLDTATNKEWRDWLPETLCDFCGLGDEDVAKRDKLLATQVGAVNPDVFDSWQLFTAVNSAFNHRRANFQWLDKPTYLEAAWTCFALRQLQPGVEFKDGAYRFLEALMVDDGVCFFPWSGGPGILLVDDEVSLHDNVGPRVKQLWVHGELASLTLDGSGELDEKDPLHVHLAKIAAAQDYIRAQHSSTPASYQE